MGLRAGLTEITPDAFDKVAAGGDPDLTGGEHYSIDKAWDDFHVIFAAKGPPLSLAISGDCRHPQSPHTLGEFCEGKHDYYLGFASPRLVKEIAKELSTVTDFQFSQWCEQGGKGQYICAATLFPDLKMAYTNAASRGNALVIVIC
jgi:hypothetical protein